MGNYFLLLKLCFLAPKHSDPPPGQCIQRVSKNNTRRRKATSTCFAKIRIYTNIRYKQKVTPMGGITILYDRKKQYISTRKQFYRSNFITQTIFFFFSFVIHKPCQHKNTLHGSEGSEHRRLF